jgi:dsDNA-binding SOS-regulon protein
MKKETLLKKLEAQHDKMLEALDEISTLLEIDMDDDELAEMSVCFREQLDICIAENEECNYNDIVEYIRENL